MKEYKAIIFDMGGVLLNLGAMWTGTEWEMRNGVPEGSLAKVLLSDQLLKQSKALFRGEMSAVEFDRTIFSELFTEIIGEKHAPVNVFSTWLPDEPNKVIVYEDMMQAIAILKQKGYLTALLTNNFFIDEERKKPTIHIDTANLDVIVESCRLGVCKPDEEIYRVFANSLFTFFSLIFSNFIN
uniref:HAD family phosphatase n=1 Tax=Ascaris lumbricoides TaxID=6252 RepID=A0A0M3ITA6_ASCLU